MVPLITVPTLKSLHGVPAHTHHTIKKDSNMFKSFTAMLKNDDGQGLVEYALIIALVSIVAISSLTLLGKKASNTLSNAAAALS